ncbi:hypothetical protein PM082_004817 [Marasmius tenuissimus]|nr:hypothetical protein PM082_004817 [Marasmius tenuissimus]
MSAIKKFSREIWDMIFSFILGADALPVVLTCKLFRELGRRPLNDRIVWKRSNVFLQWQQGYIGVDGISKFPRHVQLGALKYQGTSLEISFSAVLPVIQSFVNLRTLELQHIYIPLHQMSSILCTLPHINTLCLRHIIRRKELVWGRHRQQHNCSLRSITLDHVCATSLPSDIGFKHVVDLLTVEGLNDIHVTIDSFIDILDTHIASGVVFPSTLKVLDVRTFDDQVNKALAGTLSVGAYGSVLASMLNRCSTGLRDLSIWSADTMLPPEESMHLPSLERLVGSHALLCKLFPGQNISQIWVPTPIATSNIPWRHSVHVPCGLNLTHLSVLLWDSTDTSIESLCIQHPNIIELSLEPQPAISKVSSRLFCLSVTHREKRQD